MGKLSETAYVAPSAILLGDVTLEAESSIWYMTVVRGDSAPITIGERTCIQDGCIVHCDPGIPCSIGKQVGVGHGVILHSCVVEDDCLIGMGAVLLNRVHVGTGSVVGAGAVLPEGLEVPPRSLVLGVPAKVVRSVDEHLAQRIEKTWRDYVGLARRHRQGMFPLIDHGLRHKSTR